MDDDYLIDKIHDVDFVRLESGDFRKKTRLTDFVPVSRHEIRARDTAVDLAENGMLLTAYWEKDLLLE